MIRIQMNRLKHTVELELPTDYERVLVCLWKLGLDRDPRKYTLRDLKAVFHYDTPDEHQMIRMIESGDTLMFALISLHQMIAPPYSIAELLRGKIFAGCYNTADEFYADLEKKVFKPSTCQSSFFFPISAELVDKKGIARKAGDDVLLKYEYMVGEAMMRIASQSLYQLGRIYYFGNGVRVDQEKGLEYLKEAASHGNEYAANLLVTIQQQHTWGVASCTASLIAQLGRIFQEQDQKQSQRQRPRMDRKHRREIEEKKQAMGIRD